MMMMMIVVVFIWEGSYQQLKEQHLLPNNTDAQTRQAMILTIAHSHRQENTCFLKYNDASSQCSFFFSVTKRGKIK